MKKLASILFAAVLSSAFGLAAETSLAAPAAITNFVVHNFIPQDTVKAKKKSTSVSNKGENVYINSNGKGKYTYINSNNNRREELNYEGAVKLNEKFTDVESIAPGGYLKYMRSVNDDTKRIEITSDKAGNLTRTYTENGKTVAYEPAGREWLQQMMPDLMATTGLGAEERVKELYQKGGAKAVLSETEKIQSENGRMRYVNLLLKQPNLPATDLQLALQHVSKSSESDYERRKTLGNIATANLNNAGVVTAYLQVTDGINSDYERRKALVHLLEMPSLSSESMAKALEQTGKISSDYEKSKVLQQLAGKPDFINNNYKAALSVIEKIDSDYEKSKTISYFIKQQKFSMAQYQELLPVVSRIGSDYEKTKVLRNIAANIPADATALREDYRKTASTIGSDYEKKKALDALK